MVRAKVSSDARGNLVMEAIGEGTLEITMPRGFDHGSPAAYPAGSLERDLT